jgi:hypothetical protein
MALHYHIANRFLFYMLLVALALAVLPFLFAVGHDQPYGAALVMLWTWPIATILVTFVCVVLIARLVRKLR